MATGGPNLPVPGAARRTRRRAFAGRSGRGAGRRRPRRARARLQHGLPPVGAARRSAASTPCYTSAGDDVDVCWKLLDRGGEIAFSPAAQVRHHRRDTVRGYLRSSAATAARAHGGRRITRTASTGSGRALVGRLRRAAHAASRPAPVVYHGPMGVAPFQTELLDRAAATTMWAGALVPLLVLAGVVALPFALMTPWALVLPAAVLVLLCAYAACVAIATPVSMSEPSPWRLRTLVGVLHLLQPLARMWGRLRGRPLPSRERPERPWTGNREEWLLAIYRDLSAHWCALRRGSPHSSWDIEVSVGPVLRCRIHTAVRWEWDPVARRTWALRRPAVAALGLALLALLVTPAIGAVVTAVLLASASVEAVVLTRLSRDAVTHTTRAAQDGEQR